MSRPLELTAVGTTGVPAAAAFQVSATLRYTCAEQADGHFQVAPRTASATRRPTAGHERGPRNSTNLVLPMLLPALAPSRFRSRQYAATVRKEKM
jgi:hypothetical protein